MNRQQMRVIYQSQECYQIQILQEISKLHKIQENVASDLIEQTSDLSENHTEVNMDISAKKT